MKSALRREIKEVPVTLSEDEDGFSICLFPPAVFVFYMKSIKLEGL